MVATKPIASLIASLESEVTCSSGSRPRIARPTNTAAIRQPKTIKAVSVVFIARDYSLAARSIRLLRRMSLLARLVIRLSNGLGLGLLLLRRHLVRPKLEGQLVNASSEVKRQLIAIVHAR